ncbi:MAG: formate dehydrogenase accessory sulfurtransferase FdhD [Microcoleaceae cyanobacterium]|jgi:FdhD protein
MTKIKTSKTKSQVWVVENGTIRHRFDQVTTEEPLEIRLVNPDKTLAVTMRSPGHDFELTAGFLYGEGVITKRDDIRKISYCVNPKFDGEQRENIVTIELQHDLNIDFPSLERHFYTSSACGVCGKANLDALRLKGYPSITSDMQVSPEVIYQLPQKLKDAQKIFAKTGGLHAAALFDHQGKLLLLREDIGRHNAVDKLIGSVLLNGELPLSEHILMVSGRSSFEILQKSLVAGIPIVCAVSAPSSLAVSLAQEFGITLIGFLREERFNVYTGMEKIKRPKHN